MVCEEDLTYFLMLLFKELTRASISLYRDEEGEREIGIKREGERVRARRNREIEKTERGLISKIYQLEVIGTSHEPKMSMSMSLKYKKKIVDRRGLL